MSNLYLEVKEILEDYQTRTAGKPVIVKEPPHFFCDGDHCVREAKIKRTYEQLEHFVRDMDMYLVEVKTAMGEHKEKRTKVERVIKDVEELAKKEEKKPEPAPAAPPAKPAAPAAPVPKK